MKQKKKYTDFSKIPSEVIILQMAKQLGTPIGTSTYNRIIEKYPEYFPEEYDRHKRWEAIPKSVHDAYWKEYWEYNKALWENEPKSGGLMSMINNDEQYQKYNEAYQRLRPLEEAKEKELHEKYYAKYGF